VIPTETIIIAGPTGAGKTDLSLRLAEALGGEIVGADAFQIYRGIPVLTAQPSAGEQEKIPHHLIGSVDPSEAYDAGRYRREAVPILEAIVARGKCPIVVGGTGLYVKALLGGLNELPSSNPKLRQGWERLSLSELIMRLSELDADAPGMIDLANRRRVERALEIVLLTGKPLAASRTGATPPPPGVRALLITRAREELNARIDANVVSMFLRGVEAEVAALPEEKTGPTASMTLGLQDVRLLLRGERSRAEAIAAIATMTRRFAKRQMTWFRNQHDFPILNLSHFPEADQGLTEALRLLAV
jgi:tRNA dimethylallyltransferase